MTLTKAQRAVVREMFGGKCAYCGQELPEKGWHADHIEPVWREWWKKTPLVRHEIQGDKVVRIEEKQKMGMGAPELDVIENIFPACRPCNLDKMAMSLETWRRILQDKCNIALRASTPLRHAQRFGMVHFSDAPIVFHFEKFLDTPTEPTQEK